MKYATLHSLLGLSLLLYGSTVGGWAWLPAWFGLCFLVMGFAYGKRNPRIYGKRPDGGLPLWSWGLFLPVHLFALAVWHLIRLLSREPAVSRVNDQLWIGRRLLGSELPTSIRLVVDLTAEFREPPDVALGRDYRSFPILDASTPDEASLRAFIQSLPDSPTFVHCAQGHGRTGLFAVAFLVSRNHCSSVEEARALLASARPLLRLNGEQEQFIARLLGGS